MRLVRASAGAALLFCIAAGCSQSAPVPHPEPAPATPVTGTSREAIQGGALDGVAHPFVVGICLGSKANCGTCTGTLILPNVVVTARHCVDATPEQIDCAVAPRFGARTQNLWITTASDMTTAGVTWHNVASVTTPTDDRICGHDIALLTLSATIPDTEAKPATPGVQYPLTEAERYVRRFTAVGYGRTSPVGVPDGVGVRRIKTGISILCIPGDEFIPCPPDLEENEFVGGDGTCKGDSGSSAFDDAMFAKNTFLSFGVLSRGGDNAVDGGPPATLCKESVYTRLDKWRDLVVGVAQTASANWTLYPKPVPDWTVYVPPAVDAGAETSVPVFTNLDDGVSCNSDDECASHVCADTGAGKACTLTCDPNLGGQCYAGFYCKTNICVQGSAPAAPGGQTTTDGCSVAGAPGAGDPLGAGGRGLVIAMVGLAWMDRRRRRHRKPAVLR